MNNMYYCFYGKYSIGIFTDLLKLMKYKNSILGYHYGTFPTIEEAVKFVTNGYNSTRFVSGRIDSPISLKLNRIYQTKDMVSLGWISAS